MSRCLVDGCPKEIPPPKLMCAPHWSAVPRDLKLHIWVLCEAGFGCRSAPWQAAAQAAAREAKKHALVPADVPSNVPSSGSPPGG